MDPILHYRVYRGEINKEAILEYIKYFKPCHLYYIIKDHVWRAKFKIKNWRKTPIIKID